ncbi:hypothetical protein [Streptomyces sp. NPDC060184]|uniref:hypothetical protein n=1 Tax=Streptomyces sp. NPDC060184 TaxID=3347064 RepID=UPI003664A69E
MKAHAADHQHAPAEPGSPDDVAGHRADGRAPWWSSPGPIVWGLAAATAVRVLSMLPSDDEIAAVASLPVFLLAFGAGVALCLSPWWSRTRRWIALAWLLLPNLLLALGIAATDNRAMHLTLSAVSLAVRVGTLWWMWHNRTVPAPDRHRFPHWARGLSWIAVVAVAVAETVLWVVTL